MRNKRRDTSAPIGPVGQAVPLPLPRDAAVQGQVTPLPLPRESDGEAVPLPLPKPGEDAFRPLPLPREGGDAPAPLQRREPEARDGKPGKGHAITQRVATEILDRAKEHHGRLNNVGAAFRIASREVGVRLYRREDGVYDLKPPTKLEQFVQEWAKGVKIYTPPAEPEDVAKLRRAWDEAARSGDPDRMTRTANDLIRAVTNARARGDMPAAREGDADPTREILNPQRGRLNGDYEHAVRDREHASIDNLRSEKGDGALALDRLDGGYVLRVPEAVGRLWPTDAGESGEPARGVESAHGENQDAVIGWEPGALGGVLSRDPSDFAGEQLSAAWRDEVQNDRTQSDALNFVSKWPLRNAEVLGNDDGLTGADATPLSASLSYREQSQYDHDRSGGDIGQDFDDAIDSYFGNGFTVIAADRVPPMGRIAMEKVLNRRLKPVEVEALQAIRVLGRRLTRAERVELLSRNVIRGRLAEEATAKFFKAMGFKVWAQNATIVTKAGIRRIDVVVRDRLGRFWAIESKAGGASRNAYQRRVDLEIERNGGVFVGERAGPLDGVRHRMGTIVMEIPGI